MLHQFVAALIFARFADSAEDEDPAAYFIIEKQKMTFADAEAFCNTMGRHLASVRDEEDRDLTRDLCSKAGGGCYLGLIQDGSGAHDPWRWIDGAALNFGFDSRGAPTTGVDPWWPGEPNNKGAEGAEDCLQIVGGGRGYTWNDVVCTTTQYPICGPGPYSIVRTVTPEPAVECTKNRDCEGKRAKCNDGVCEESGYSGRGSKKSGGGRGGGRGEDDVCYPTGPCDRGYMDKTDDNYYYWACGSDCVGGKYYTDIWCVCACVPEAPCDEEEESVLFGGVVDVRSVQGSATAMDFMMLSALTVAAVLGVCHCLSRNEYQKIDGTEAEAVTEDV